MFGTDGTTATCPTQCDWRSTASGVTTTGLDGVDLWVGGLAEVTNLFGGMLGSTFNYVFQTQLEKLQDGDRLYYLNRTPGMNLRTQLEGNSFSELIMRNTTAPTRSRPTPSARRTASSSSPTSRARRRAYALTAPPSPTI